MTRVITAIIPPNWPLMALGVNEASPMATIWVGKLPSMATDARFTSGTCLCSRMGRRPLRRRAEII